MLPKFANSYQTQSTAEANGNITKLQFQPHSGEVGGSPKFWGYLVHEPQTYIFNDRKTSSGGWWDNSVRTNEVDPPAKTTVYCVISWGGLQILHLTLAKPQSKHRRDADRWCKIDDASARARFAGCSVHIFIRRMTTCHGHVKDRRYRAVWRGLNVY